eukprot:PITA_27620
MLGYDFEIIYKKGKKNVVADALSRKDEDVEALLFAISIIQPDWINEAREEWKNEEEVWALIRNLQQDSSTSDTFSWKNDSLWYKDRLYLCKNSQLKQKILLEFHASPLGGNSRFLKTYHRFKKEFFWDGLKSDIENFVKECLTQWVKWLPLAEWSYNTSFHTATKMTPIMALYGYQPPSITSYLRENSKVQVVEHHIEHQQQVLQLLKDNLVLVQNRNETTGNQHRNERSFDVGDWVFLRLQPYKQMSLNQAQKDNKLSPK